MQYLCTRTNFQKRIHAHRRQNIILKFGEAGSREQSKQRFISTAAGSRSAIYCSEGMPDLSPAAIPFLEGSLLILLLAVPLYFLFRDKDPFPTVPGSKFMLPWKLRTLEFSDNRLQFVQSEFAKHGNIFKAVLYGQRVIFLGGAQAVKIAADSTAAASTPRSYCYSNRSPPYDPGRPMPMVMSEKGDSQHDLKRSVFHSSLLKICNDPYFFSEKLPDLFDIHFTKASSADSSVNAVDLCKSVFWDICINLFFSDVTAKGEFTAAVLNWVISLHSTQMDLMKSSLFGTLKPTNMSAVDKVFSDEVRIRMEGGWRPGNDAIGEMLKAAMEMADVENMSSLVEKTLLTDGWNFIFATNVKLASACCWLLVALENSPEAKAAAITEARNYPISGEVSFTLSSLSDRRILPYIGHVVDEAIRMYGCFSLPDFSREAKTDVEFEGHKIKKGSIMVLPLEYHNYHPINFPDPNTFNPSRFYSKNEEVAAKCKTHSIASFGFGEHSCPGAGFSKALMKLFAYMALRRYDFTAVPNQCFDPIPPTVSGEIWTIPADRLRFQTFTSRSTL